MKALARFNGFRFPTRSFPADDDEWTFAKALGETAGSLFLRPGADRSNTVGRVGFHSVIGTCDWVGLCSGFDSDLRTFSLCLTGATPAVFPGTDRSRLWVSDMLERRAESFAFA